MYAPIHKKCYIILYDHTVFLYEHAELFLLVSVLASELRLYDDYVNARSGENRADAVAKAKRKSPRLARAASGTKQAPPVTRRALQLYSPANDRTVTGTSASSTSSTSKDDYPAETMSTIKGDMENPHIPKNQIPYGYPKSSKPIRHIRKP